MHQKRRCAIVTVGVACLLCGTVQAGALVGCWPFDGDLKDQAGTAPGTFVGGQPVYQKGQVGPALSFDGTDDYVNLPSPVNPSVYTISVWVNPARTDAAGVVTRTDPSGPGTSWSHQLRIQDGVFHHYLWVGAERNVPGTTKIVPNTWYHVAIVAQNNGPMRLYVNGQEDGVSISTAGMLWGSGDRIHVGSNSGHGMGWFQGLVDDLRIYDRELAPAQIKDTFRGTPPAFVKAENPIPADGALAVTMPLLQWTKGETAVLHDVYVGTSPELTVADRIAVHQPTTFSFYAAGLQPGATYYWRVDEIDKDGTTVHTGDVWSFVVQALTAYRPSPADGAVDAAPAPVLTWLPGQVTLKHHLYLGNNSEAVTEGAAEADKGELTDPTFTPGALESLTTYYWRVDEVLATGGVRTGPVWSFTTCRPLDDFERYTDQQGETIYDAWIDGLGNSLSGSMVGYANAPFAELKIVHGGLQSMPFDYNNTKPPYYSEAQLDFVPAQDWTVDGAAVLVLYVQGRAGNSPAPLYVAVEDASKHVAVVVHPDQDLVRAAEWTAWSIPLDTLAGVDVAAVRSLRLGVGARDATAPGGTGLLYLDDIGLTK